MRVLVCGDFHGDLNHAGYIAQIAKNNGCEIICVAGDFGYWPHTDPLYVEHVSGTLAKRGVHLAFVDGNHEAFYLDSDPKKPRHGLFQLDGYPRTCEGFVALSGQISYIPRGTRWRWGETVFLGIGGAYSIDKQERLNAEQGGTPPYGRPGPGPRTYWWPEELITADDVTRCLTCEDPELADVQVVIAHDAPVGSIDFDTFKDDLESDQNRRYLKQIVDQLRPNTLFHGHYHRKREGVFRFRDGWPVRVVGLDCNGAGDDSWVVLEA